jgi:hypothetical protein
MNQEVQITIDDGNQIRVLEGAKFQQTQQLEQSCHEFSDKIQNFSGEI